MDDQQTYAVTDEDLRNLAEQAAAGVAESEGMHTDTDLQFVAESAASQAIEEYRGVVEDTTQRQLTQVAQETAQRTLEGQEENNANETKQETQQADEGSTQEVVLQADQWQYLQDSMRIQSATSVMSLMISCAIMGALLANHLLEGWRK